jgi:hypothetical protein
MGWAYSGQHETLHQVCNQIHHQSFYTLPQNLSPSLNQFCPIALTKKGNKLHSKKTCHPNSKYQMSAPQKTQLPTTRMVIRKVIKKPLQLKIMKKVI